MKRNAGATGTGRKRGALALGVGLPVLLAVLGLTAPAAVAAPADDGGHDHGHHPEPGVHFTTEYAQIVLPAGQVNYEVPTPSCGHGVPVSVGGYPSVSSEDAYVRGTFMQEGHDHGWVYFTNTTGADTLAFVYTTCAIQV